jgi:predicted nucleic-acid-binding Zn-ribbon protein
VRKNDLNKLNKSSLLTTEGKNGQWCPNTSTRADICVKCQCASWKKASTNHEGAKHDHILDQSVDWYLELPCSITVHCGLVAYKL